jgi:NAD+ kinase
MGELRKFTVAGLVVKESNEAGIRTCVLVEQWFREHGVPCRVITQPHERIADTLLPGTDLLVVFAGDGTMVSVARQSLGMGIPIVGINFGRVGFLAELSEGSWQEALEAALHSGFTTERRMAVRYALYRGRDCIRQGEVVNDVVVTRGKVARLVKLQLGVNGAPFVTLRADGLILSTPTGASGYAGSAGGPLVLPTLNAYVVAAICPYLSSFPPLVLTHETVFSITIGEAEPDLYLTLDGQEAHALTQGDRLEVSGAPDRILLADFGRKNYFSRLIQAGFIQEYKRPC